ncbi:MAG: hypothetical protein J6K61_03480 [Clostridia bacterium]|nr:hypothetical protein [Clostridia bacterium]
MKKSVSLKMNKKRWVLAAVALVLALALLTLALVLVLRPPVVYSFEGVSVRQPAYDYWVACYKYAYLVSQKDLRIEDTYYGWQQKDETGQTYQELFQKEIEGAIFRRLVAAALFDKEGHTLPTADYQAVKDIIEGFAYYDDEEPLKDLKEQYGVTKRQITQIGVWEIKYRAYRYALFGDDLSGVYDDEYKDICQKRYEETCSRVKVIYIPYTEDEELAAMENAFADEDLTEETFIELSNTYNHLPITTEKYPNGYYFCSALENPTQGFDNGLQAAIAELKEVGDFATAENESKTGRWFVYRCSLQENGYKENDIPGFATMLADEIYYQILNKEISKIIEGKGTPLGLLSDVATCREYNLVWEIVNK